MTEVRIMTLEFLVRDALIESVKSNGGSYIFEIHKDAKDLDELGKAWYSIGNQSTENHVMLYAINCNDFDVPNNEIDGVLDSSEFSDEVNKICEEIEQKWEELKQ
mgnify:CR=1 FL=1